MGKMDDKIKANQRAERMSGKVLGMAVPQATHAAGSTVIQQLGLDRADGVQRLMLMLISKVDPDNKGFHITLDDINRALHTTVTQGKPDVLIYGHSDSIFMKLVSETEKAAFLANEEVRNQHLKTAQ